MKRATCALVLAVLLLLVAGPAAAQVVISQVYGGGGNSGATLKNDFIELLNRGGCTVSLDGWSVQYASAAGTSWQVTGLGESFRRILGGRLRVLEMPEGSSALLTPPMLSWRSADVHRCRRNAMFGNQSNFSFSSRRAWLLRI